MIKKGSGKLRLTTLKNKIKSNFFSQKTSLTIEKTPLN